VQASKKTGIENPEKKIQIYTDIYDACTYFNASNLDKAMSVFEKRGENFYEDEQN
jgi:hypothetical protein